MPAAVPVSIKDPSQGYQLGVVQEVLLALLAKDASHGYQLRARLRLALGPLAEAQLRNAMSIGEGSWLVFVQRPMSLTLLVIVVLVLLLPRVARMVAARRVAAA